jgi:Flp pilus assembly protein TadD
MLLRKITLTRNLLVRLLILFLLLGFFTACRKKERPPEITEEIITVQKTEWPQEESLPENTEGRNVQVSFLTQRPASGLSAIGGRVNVREINPINYENPDINLLKQMGVEPSIISFLTGEQFYKAGDYDKALVEYNASIRHNGEFPEALVSRGNTRLKRGEYKHAIDDYTRSIKIDGSRAELYNYRGYARAELAVSEATSSATSGAKTNNTAELKLAIEDYSQAIAITGNYTDAFINRSQALFEIGEYDRVIDDCTRIIALEPKNVYAWNRRGSAWYSKGDDDKAIKDFSEAIKLRGDYAAAWHNRGNAWYSKGELDKALADISKALVINPSFAGAYTSRGNILRLLGDNENAAADFAEAQRLR